MKKFAPFFKKLGRKLKKTYWQKLSLVWFAFVAVDTNKYNIYIDDRNVSD